MSIEVHWTERMGMTDSESDDMYSLIGAFGLAAGVARFLELHPRFFTSSSLITDRLAEEGF